ncbi:hypothetical protein JRO89_XS03G0116200 [Xanthoceras sorbifolium]|uniref:Pectinesterase inhibitor domain-containing protein n=1 Tax=Xanthoceras sorbifolium TaxID=99658 RepID=A0ABQ8I9K4_9ROSI|nr:hypothetical protein JRO89_XS03G0116200 [Xanthoceras sorbifolium]
MAFLSSGFMLLLMVVCLLFHSSSAAAVTTHMHISYKLVDAICQETENPEFCKTTLKNYPNTRKADMHELGAITILLANAQARFNKYAVDQLLHGEKDDVTKNDLSNCLSDYTVTLGKLEGAYRLSNNKDYKGMTKLVNDAMKMTKKCEYRFEKSPSRPFPLGDNQQKMVWLNDIALVTLDLLDD